MQIARYGFGVGVHRLNRLEFEIEANLSHYSVGSREDVRDVDVVSDRCAESLVFDFAPGLADDGRGRLVGANVVISILCV